MKRRTKLLIVFVFIFTLISSTYAAEEDIPRLMSIPISIDVIENANH